MSLDDASILGHLRNVIGNPSMALAFAKRANLPNIPDDLYMDNFVHLMATQKLEYFFQTKTKLLFSNITTWKKNFSYVEAAKAAATAPNNILRTPETIESLKTFNTDKNNLLLEFFGVLLDQPGKLTAFETLELCLPTLQKKKTSLVSKWTALDKLTCSEQLADATKPLDTQLACTIYEKSGVWNKYLFCLVELRNFSPIAQWRIWDERGS